MHWSLSNHEFPIVGALWKLRIIIGNHYYIYIWLKWHSYFEEWPFSLQFMTVSKDWWTWWKQSNVKSTRHERNNAKASVNAFRSHDRADDNMKAGSSVVLLLHNKHQNCAKTPPATFIILHSQIMFIFTWNISAVFFSSDPYKAVLRIGSSHPWIWILFLNGSKKYM